MELKDQPHRMKLSADRLAGLIGGISNMMVISGLTIRQAVRVTERQQKEFKEEFSAASPLEDPSRAHISYRSHVESLMQTTGIMSGDE